MTNVVLWLATVSQQWHSDWNVWWDIVAEPIKIVNNIEPINIVAEPFSS